MKITGNQSGSLHASKSPETAGDGFPPLGVRDQLQSWRQLPSCTLELITITVLPRPTPDAWRQLIDTEEELSIPGGTFSGPFLNGSIVHTFVQGSYDPLTRCINILARAKMLTNDGVIIHKTDRSRWLGNNDAIERLVNGREVADRDYYLVGILEYSVSDPSYAWLEKGQYLTRGLVEGELLHIAQFRAVPSV
jgi:hypothetical protein